MSLTRTLLNGGMYGSTINASRYGHQDGASRIAMESMEELHDIWMESFYNVEQAELAAACEGVALEGSQYQPVYEAAISGGIEKVKNFLKKLWEKVKAFFAAIRRHIDAIFMSGKEFVSKYKNEIKKLPEFKDYTVKMYKYDNETIDEQQTVDVNEVVSTLIKTFEDEGMLTIDDIINGKIIPTEADEQAHDNIASDMDREEIEKTIFKKMCDETGIRCSDPDEWAKACFSMCRNGAEDASDMDEEDLSKSDIIKFMNLLLNSKGIGKIKTAQSHTDKAYATAIKKVDKAADKAKDIKYTKVVPASGNTAEHTESTSSKTGAAIAKACREYSSALSITQGFMNTMYSEWQKAYTERDATYKKIINGAFSYAKKYEKNNK